MLLIARALQPLELTVKLRQTFEHNAPLFRKRPSETESAWLPSLLDGLINLFSELNFVFCFSE